MSQSADEPLIADPLAALENPVALELLQARIPARLAYVGPDGGPRVVPVWSHWNGHALVIGSFPRSAKLRTLADGDRVAVTIDTQEFPYQSLQLRGTVTLTPTEGLVPEYVLAARRHMDPEQAEPFLARLGNRPMVRLTIAVTHAQLMDMRAKR